MDKVDPGMVCTVKVKKIVKQAGPRQKPDWVTECGPEGLSGPQVLKR